MVGYSGGGYVVTNDEKLLNYIFAVEYHGADKSANKSTLFDLNASWQFYYWFVEWIKP